MCTKSDIILAIPSLSQRDLKEIRNRIDFFYKTNLEERDIEESLFYKIITDQLFRITGAKSISFLTFNGKSSYKKFKEVFTFIQEYSKNLLKDENKKSKRVQFYILFAKIMIQYLEEYNLRKDVGILLNAYEKFPSLLDSKFPGYMETGLFSILFGGAP